MKKKALIIGSNGYIGRHLADCLIKKGYEVIPAGRQEKSIDELPNYQRTDITRPNDLESLNFNVDLIFVFSGLSGTNIGFERYDEFVRVNEIGLLNILNQHMREKSGARIVFPSSRLVYRGVKDTPLKEDFPKEAKTIYAQNKLSCESYLKIYKDNFEIDYTVFRICVPYGNQFDQNYSYGTMGFFLDKAKQGENILLFGDGSQKRTFTHIWDVVNSMISALENPASAGQIYNVGGCDHYSLREVGEMVAHSYGVKVEYSSWPDALWKVESGDTIFDDERLLSVMNYRYQYGLKDWIESCERLSTV